MKAFNLQEHSNIAIYFKIFDKLRMFGDDEVSSHSQGGCGGHILWQPLKESQISKLGGQRQSGS